MGKGGIKALGLVLGIGLLAWVIRDAVAQSQDVEWPALPLAHMAVATALVVLAHGLHGLAWAIGAQSVAARLGLKRGIAIYSVSFIGRYIPGKIWQIGAASYLTKDRGDPLQVAGYSLFFLVIFQGFGALVLLQAYLFLEAPLGWLICCLGTLVITGMVAGAYHFGSAQVLRLLPLSVQARLRGCLDQPFKPLVANIVLLAMCWIIFGTAGYVLAQGFAPDWAGTWAQATVATIGGLIAGFLVLIAPSGAGVRESAISVSLTAMGITPIVSIAVALSLRLAMTASELIWAALGALLLFRPSLKPEKN